LQRFLKSDEQETALLLLLDVKNIPRPTSRQDDAFLGINGGCAHSGKFPHLIFSAKKVSFAQLAFFKSNFSH
jgi:hypothetical protein